MLLNNILQHTKQSQVATFRFGGKRANMRRNNMPFMSPLNGYC